ncbi:MAG: hypothetical protein GY774_20015 [Planctomycetes bacterium]|nr:hypothetical protein [Planctomycetota bacterium]
MLLKNPVNKSRPEGRPNNVRGKTGFNPPLKSRAEDMKRSRQRRRDSGLVEFRAWVTPEEKTTLDSTLKAIRAEKGCFSRKNV